MRISTTKQTLFVSLLWTGLSGARGWQVAPDVRLPTSAGFPDSRPLTYSATYPHRHRQQSSVGPLYGYTREPREVDMGIFGAKSSSAAPQTPDRKRRGRRRKQGDRVNGVRKQRRKQNNKNNKRDRRKGRDNDDNGNDKTPRFVRGILKRIRRKGEMEEEEDKIRKADVGYRRKAVKAQAIRSVSSPPPSPPQLAAAKRAERKLAAKKRNEEKQKEKEMQRLKQQEERKKKKDAKIKIRDSRAADKPKKQGKNGNNNNNNPLSVVQKLVEGGRKRDGEQWVTVFPKTRISPGELVPVTVAGIDLLVIASNDGKNRLYCIANSCPHLGTPLELGQLVRLPVEDQHNAQSSNTSSISSASVAASSKEKNNDAAATYASEKNNRGTTQQYSWTELQVSSILQQDGCEDCIVCPLHKTAFALESGQVRGEWCPYPPVLGPMVGSVKKPTAAAVFGVRLRGRDVQVRINTPLWDSQMQQHNTKKKNR